jgi:5'-3' exonuclease
VRVHEELGGEALVTVCWDDYPRHRVEMYPDYKRKRVAPTDPEKVGFLQAMLDQQRQLRELLGFAGVRQAWSSGWEADDVMGTLAQRFRGRGVTAIYTGDRDLIQCVADDVFVLRPLPKGELAAETMETVRAEWEIGVEQWVDLKALAGDASDCIPGVRGIGLKGAQKLLARFQTVQAAVDAIDDDDAWRGLPPSLREKLRDGQTSARLSYQLARINVAAPLTFEAREKWAERQLVAEFTRLGFKTMLRGERYRVLRGMGG